MAKRSFECFLKGISFVDMDSDLQGRPNRRFFCQKERGKAILRLITCIAHIRIDNRTRHSPELN